MSFRFEHVGVAVDPAKFDEVLRFYVDVLGWELSRENPGGVRFVTDGADRYLEFYPRQDPEPISKPHHLAFSCGLQELDQVATAIASAGVSCEELKITPAGDSVIYFRDPAGNSCQIIARPKPLEGF